MQARDFLQPVTLLHSRSTLADALDSLARLTPVFVRDSNGWAFMRPEAVVGFPTTRQMLDLPLESVTPIAPDADLDIAIRNALGRPVAVAEFGQIIGCVDPIRIDRLHTSHTTPIQDGLLLRVVKPLTHDLANALFALDASLTTGGSDAWSESLACQAALRHTSSLLARLRDICTGATEDAPEQLDVTSVLSSMLDVLQLVSGSGVKVRLRQDSPTPSIRAYERAIERALINLVLNASEAMQHRGHIEISTRADETASQMSIVIRIDDDGPGLNHDSCARIFEPGYSSKSGDGRGLGLESVIQALSRVGGTLQLAESSLGGTAFELWFPAAL